MLSLTGQLVGQEYEISDDVEDPVENACHGRSILVQIALTALLRNEDGGDDRKPQPQQADRMADPADHDQQRHAKNDLNAVELLQALDSERHGKGHGVSLRWGQRASKTWQRPRRAAAPVWEVVR